jgi:Ca2+-binding EF-hand superfamily protein
MHSSRHSSPNISIEAVLLTLAAVAGAAAVTIAASAVRQDAPPTSVGPGRPLGFAVFAALDTDGQPGLSASELANAATVLLALDRNADGHLTADELPTPAPGRFGGRGGRFGGEGRQGRGGSAPPAADDMVNMLMSFDRNADGTLTRSEVPERVQGVFDRADGNRDGAITAEEIRATVAAHAQSDRVRPDRRGMDGRGERPSGRRGPDGRARFGGRDPIMRTLDADADGTLSREELAGAAAALRALDRDGDGIVTRQEAAGGGGRGRP